MQELWGPDGAALAAVPTPVSTEEEVTRPMLVERLVRLRVKSGWRAVGGADEVAHA